MSDQKPCPSCGHCPTCGHTPRPVQYYWPYPTTWPYPYYQPYTITCGGDTSGLSGIGSSGNVMTNITSDNGYTQTGGAS